MVAASVKERSRFHLWRRGGYYFYFMDAAFGLIYLRVPTWAPLRLQFYSNGHNGLARRLTSEAFVTIMLSPPRLL